MISSLSHVSLLSLSPSPCTRYGGVLLLAATLGAGCAANQDDDDVSAAELALDTGDGGQAEASLLTAALDGQILGTSLAQATAPEVLAAINARLSTRFVPAGCATAVTSGTTLTVTFAGCTGPRGLRSVEGTLALTVASTSPTAIQLTAKAERLQLGNTELSLDASATYASGAGGGSLTVDTRSGGVGPLGHALEHTGQYVATWTADCASIDGAWSTALDGRQRSVVVDLSRCTATCATGNITRTTRDGRELHLTLDGTSATWTSSTGRTGTLPLRCGR
ncbi:MAG TPA: hypothetical protein PKU97_10475 [Kofleriaceae bacterium]|nr:hypothetical protein [Kofleriaceae bacterium]